MFDEEGALDRFEAFASLNGPAFYRLPVNTETVTLQRAPVDVPDEIGGLVPFRAGERLLGVANRRLAQHVELPAPPLPLEPITTAKCSSSTR